jgi:hypothetical protein
MENIRRQAKMSAENLRLRASSAGTADLFDACFDMVVQMAVSLECNKARNTGDPGFGILFEVAGKENPGQFSFFATRPKLGRGVVALAISDDAVGDRAVELHTRVRDILRRHQGVPVPVDGRYTWPAIGFTTVSAGEQIIQEITAFLLNQKPSDRPTAESTVDSSVLRSIKERQGQPAFRQRLLAAYDSRCVISGCSVVEALEAVHIVPHSENGAYDTSNGLLMRADIHTLFDLHLLSVCPDKNAVQLNPRLRATYGEFEGKVLQAPHNQADKPDRVGLAKHRAIWETLFRKHV